MVTPVSLQCYPHRRDVYLRNYIRGGDWSRRASMLASVLPHQDLQARMRSMLDAVCARGGVFHLWGHSWEMDQFNGWQTLDSFLRYAAERIPATHRLSNLDVLCQRGLPGVQAPVR